MKEQTVWVLMVLIVFLGLVLSTPVFSACSSDEYGNCTGSCSCAAGQLGGCHCDPEHSCREVNTCYYPASTSAPTKKPSDTPPPTSQGACNLCEKDPNPCGEEGTYTSCTDTYQSGKCGYICTYKNSPTPNPTIKQTDGHPTMAVCFTSVTAYSFTSPSITSPSFGGVDGPPPDSG